ncbi:MAG: hypothetical protein HKN09_04735 [Saprospiraceae bacterium]|nr:hypothetical protein [Saprospiraceae bacterium]
MNPNIDQYLIDGCGRCNFYKTPQCKVNKWRKELILLRSIILESNLEEEYKWSQPCYTFKGKNVLMLSALKEFVTISFFKGSLLKDSKGLLITPGQSSQADRQFRFQSLNEIEPLIGHIKSYIKEAIEIEKKGLSVAFKKNPEPIPQELQGKFVEDPEFECAFKSLTPGRQRGYILYFSQPKQEKTRLSRIAKWYSKIMEGKGIQDDYRSRNK